MRDNFFYILIICAFTEILTKNEENKSAGKEAVRHTRGFYEEEAKKDIQNLLSSLKNHDLNEGYQDDTQLLNADAPRSKIMERIDEILKKNKTKKAEQKNLRSTAQITQYLKRGAHVHNSALNLRNPIKSSSNLHNFDANNNQFLQLMNTLMIPNSVYVKSRISGGYSVNNLLRNSVNLVDIKPEVYPVLIVEDEYGSREISSEEDIQISDQYYRNDKDELIELPNKVDTEHKNQSTIRTATIPITENFDLEELLNQLDIKRGEVISTRKESDTNARLNDFLNKFYSQSADHLRPGNRLENAHNYSDKLENNIDSKDRDNSKTIFQRSDLDNVHPNPNEGLDEFMKYSDIEQNLRTSHNTLSHGNSPVRQGDRRGRQRRSTNTQAGYTQDPDTCKTYNENLVKLWSNLLKLINVTEQPNERDLHNIAMMIQAYLEHQNAKQPPDSQKAKHEGPRDKISEVMFKIRKLLEETKGSAEKITKVIIKYLKPDYMDAETEDCQQVNEEFLGSSVDLLYKNYLENTDCEGEDDRVVRNKKLSLRERKVKSGKFSNRHTILLLATSDLNPEFQTVLIEDKLYNDFHKGKVPRQRSTNKYRRVFKRSKNKRSRPAYRSGNQNESEKLETRSKASSKSSSKKQKQSSLKSDLVKSKCEKYLTRKLIISLRPVMERFIGLLECQLDHTLRSVIFGKDSKNPYVYASKFYSNDNSERHRKISRLQAKDTGRKINKSYKKQYTKRHYSSFEHDQYFHERDDETDSAWVRKYSFDQIKGMNSGTHAVARDTDVRKSDTKNNKQNGNSDYLTTYNEYFQSPSLYDDHDGIYKTHQISNSNGFTSLINPAISLNDKKSTRFKSTNLKLASSDKGQDKKKDKNDEYAFFQESFSKESNHAFNFDKQTESDNIEQPFIDLTKLRDDDQLIEGKSKVHVKTFEGIAEFLKRTRDASLQTPELAVPFVLDTNKGYVELTHLIKYPKMLVYRPQFLVKHTMPYNDFLKTISNINMTNDDVRLIKIVRHLPDSSVHVLFETEDFEAPLEVQNLNDKRRSGSPDSVVNQQFESRIERGSENTNADLTDRDSEDLILNSQNEARRKDVDTLVKLESVSNSEDLYPDFNIHLETLRVKAEQSPNMYFDYNSDTNLTSNSKPNSLESNTSSWFSPIANFSSGLIPKNPSSDSGQDVGQGTAIGSAVGSQLKSSKQLGLDTALGFNLNPIHSSPLGSFFIKLLPSHSNTQSTSNPSLNSQSHINSYTDSSAGSLSASNSYSQINSHSGSWSNSNSGSHSLLPYTDSSNKEVGNNFSSLNSHSGSWSNSNSGPHSLLHYPDSINKEVGNNFSSLNSHSGSWSNFNSGLHSLLSYNDTRNKEVGNNFSSLNSHSGSWSNSNSGPHSLLPYPDSINKEVGNNFSSLNSHSGSLSDSNSGSHSLLPYTDSSNKVVGNNFSSLNSHSGSWSNFNSGLHSLLPYTDSSNKVVGNNFSSLNSHSGSWSNFNSGLHSLLPYTDSSNKAVGNNFSSLNSHSGSWSNSNSGSHSLLPYTDSSNKEVGNNFSSLNSHSGSWSNFNSGLHSLLPYTDSSNKEVGNNFSSLNSHSGSWSNSNSGPHSLLPYPDSSNKEVGNNFSSSPKSIVLRWWRKWKNIVKGKMKQIIGNMASLTDKVDHIIKQ